MNTSKPAISIIIPARNEGGRVLKAIQSFVAGRSTSSRIEFVIVDDASEDGCCDLLDTIFNNKENAVLVQVVKLNRWSGIPYARNIGAATALAPILFITDANVEAAFGWDRIIFDQLQPGQVLCATIADMDSDWRGYGCVLNTASMGIDWLLDPTIFKKQVPVSPCAGTILHAQLFRFLGGYDTAMPVYGAAEAEFSVRVWLYGASIICCPELLLLHRFRPPEERRPFLEQIAFVQTKNYLRFGMLYLDERGIIRLMNHWSATAPEQFAAAVQQVTAGDVWKRRLHLRDILPRTFAWYSNYFNLQ